MVFLLIAVIVVVIDQITKLWVTSLSLSGKLLPEFGCLRIIYVENTGSAFGLFANSGQAFLLSCIAIIGIITILVFYRYITGDSTLGRISLGLVLGGAIGNLIDRLRLGYVVDFIDVRLWHGFHWPTFNVADSAITVGTISLACFIFLVLKKKK